MIINITIKIILIIKIIRFYFMIRIMVLIMIWTGMYDSIVWEKVVGRLNAKTKFGKNVFNNKDNKILFIRCNDDLNWNNKNNVND